MNLATLMGMSAMSRSILPVVLSAVLAASSTTAAAQEGCGPLLRAPATGGWADFRLERAGVQDMRVRFAIVGAERRGEKSLVWFETKASGVQQGGEQVVQVLVPGYPYQSSQIEDLVARRDSLAPVRLAPGPLARARTQKPRLLASVAEGCRGARLIGEERITVPAGTFSTRHYRDAAGETDIWIDPSQPFGVVRMVSRADASRLELAATGSDARSSIPGKPATPAGD